MALEHLWQDEAFRKAFQRWWDEDWSWEGLKEKYLRESLGSDPDESLGSLQSYWHAEQGQLLSFAGRQWTRFHLPPFDREGNPCPGGLWNAAKDTSYEFALSKILHSVKALAENKLRRDGLLAVTDFAELSGVIFPETFTFDGDALIVNLRAAIFMGMFNYSGRISALFYAATFSGDAVFTAATFSGDAVFTAATFTGDAVFTAATFSGIAEFSFVTFRGLVYFDAAKFVGHAVFNFVTFVGYALFYSATFGGYAWFGKAIFGRDVDFRGITPFSKGSYFSGVCFCKDADFSGRDFKEKTDFSNTYFCGTPKFHGAKFHPDTSFLNADFRDGKACRELPRRRRGWFWKPESKYIKGVRTQARQSLRTYWRWRKIPFGLHHPALREVRKAHDFDAEEYEISYRQLRRLCADIGSIEYEGMFHALELRAHRARTDTNPTARLASWLYGISSDYGRSMGRPLACLIGAWVVFATLYLVALTPPYENGGLGLSAEACRAMAWPARSEIWIAAAREFLPSLFGASAIANQPEWLRCAQANHQMLFFGFVVAQIIIFIGAVALFLIALRRRFRLRD